MPNNTPKNLPTEGKSLLENVNKNEPSQKAPPSLPKKNAEPIDSAPKEPKETSQKQSQGGQAEDIFANVAEAPTPEQAPISPASQAPASSAPQQAPAQNNSSQAETEIETPQHGFKKILLTIGLIVIFTAVLAGVGYFAYNQFLKPQPMNSILNLDNTGATQTAPQQQQPQQPQQPQVPVQPVDSDNDGLSDAEEASLGTDPRNPDSDGDRLFDREETEVYGTDPLSKDTDGDGFEDGSEVQNGYDPKGPGKLIRIPGEQ